MILSAQTILSRQYMTPIFVPFHHPQQVAFGLTYGLGPAGYDIRIAENVWLEPHSFKLASSYEHICIPDDLIAFVKDKSTWARLGLAVQNTVIEPGWQGYLTIELSNHSQRRLEIVKRSPIAQIILQMLDQPTTLPYKGRYQNQGPGAHAARLITEDDVK